MDEALATKAEMIRVNCDSDRPTVSARELHEFLGVDTDYPHWFSRMCEYGFTENADYRTFLSDRSDGLPGKPRQDAEITLDMAKELCMIQRNDRGRQARQYFIRVENEWNNPEMVMARAVKMADAKVKRLEAKVESDKPKVLFADSVSGSQNSILIRELSKMLNQNGINLGEKKLFEWMRENGYLIRKFGRDYNSPTKYSMEHRLMEVKETAISQTAGTQTKITPLITGKGQQYFINKFLKGEKS